MSIWHAAVLTSLSHPDRGFGVGSENPGGVAVELRVSGLHLPHFTGTPAGAVHAASFIGVQLGRHRWAPALNERREATGSANGVSEI